jgi:hypothetical protein
MLPIFALLGVAYLLLLDRIIVSLSLIRHSFFLVPILYVLLARSILCRRKTLGNLLIGIVLFLNILALGTYYNETTKLPWQEAGMILDANTHGDAVIIMDDSISANLLLEYYTEKQYNVNGEVRNVDQIWVIETKKFKGPQITGERFELDGITLTSTNFIK